MSEAVELLFVKAAGQTFGIPVEQVERLVPIEQVERLVPIEQVERPVPIERLGAKQGALAAGLGFAPDTGRRASHALWSRGGTAWEIEGLGDIEILPLETLRRLPALLRPGAGSAFWGAAVAGEGLILLVDLDRLGSTPESPTKDTPKKRTKKPKRSKT